MSTEREFFTPRFDPREEAESLGYSIVPIEPLDWKNYVSHLSWKPTTFDEALTDRSWVSMAQHDEGFIDPGIMLELSLEILRDRTIAQETQDYFQYVSMPLIHAMHQNNPFKSSNWVTLDFVEHLLSDARTDTTIEVQRLTQQMVRYVKQREYIAPAFVRTITSWNKRYQEETEDLGIIGGILFGSHARDDSHLFSDVDVLFFSTQDVRNTKYDEHITYTDRLFSHLRGINRYMRSTNQPAIWLEDKQHLLQNIELYDPELFSYHLFGSEESKATIQKFLLNSLPALKDRS